jgi:hypothetical protein
VKPIRATIRVSEAVGVLCWFVPGPGRKTLVRTFNSRAPKAPTALDSNCSHFNLADLEDLLPLGSWNSFWQEG